MSLPGADPNRYRYSPERLKKAWSSQDEVSTHVRQGRRQSGKGRAVWAEAPSRDRLQQPLGLALTSRNPGQGGGGVCVLGILSLCCPPPGTFGQPTFSKALGMLVAQALAAFFAPRPREPPLHRSGESAGSSAASRVGPGPAAGEQRQGVGKTSPTSSGIDSRREIFALGLGGKFRLPLLGFP